MGSKISKIGLVVYLALACLVCGMYAMFVNLVLTDIQYFPRMITPLLYIGSICAVVGIGLLVAIFVIAGLAMVFEEDEKNTGQCGNENRK